MSDPAKLQNQYSTLMKNHTEGIFLYKPQDFSKFHPGSVGFFDNEANWHEITDISKIDQKHGLTRFDSASSLERMETKPEIWKEKTSSGEQGSNIRGSAGLSGLAATAVPGEVEAELSHEKSATQKAALVTENEVYTEKFYAPFSVNATNWVRDNAKELTGPVWGKYVKDHGLWAVQGTWITESCAINMSNMSEANFQAGLDLKATGFGKVGAGAGAKDKAENHGWTVYEGGPGQERKVVSFCGTYFKPHVWTGFMRKNALKEIEDMNTLQCAMPGDDSDEDPFAEVEMCGVTDQDRDAEEDQERKALRERIEQNYKDGRVNLRPDVDVQQGLDERVAAELQKKERLRQARELKEHGHTTVRRTKANGERYTVTVKIGPNGEMQVDKSTA